jgi:hypothetical protein
MKWTVIFVLIVIVAIVGSLVYFNAIWSSDLPMWAKLLLS